MPNTPALPEKRSSEKCNTNSCEVSHGCQGMLRYGAGTDTHWQSVDWYGMITTGKECQVLPVPEVVSK